MNPEDQIVTNVSRPDGSNEPAKVSGCFTASRAITAEQAMEEIWGLLCPDCGPEDYRYIVNEVLYRINQAGVLFGKKAEDLHIRITIDASMRIERVPEAVSIAGEVAKKFNELFPGTLWTVESVVPKETE